jgi:hypothetical protein
VLVIKLRKRCSVCVFLLVWWGKGTEGSREESERAPHLSVAVVPDGTERGGEVVGGELEPAEFLANWKICEGERGGGSKLQAA